MMASRTARIASSIVAGLLVGAPLTAPWHAAQAAECLTEPGKDGTPGQHWYYRLERGTKRHCWYLRDQDGKAAQTAPSDNQAQTAAATPQTSDNARSIEDARAEYPMPQQPQAGGSAPVMRAQSSTPPEATPPANPPQANPPQADAQGSAVATRWPSPEAAAAMPAPSAAPATTAAAPAAATDATSPAPVATATPDAPDDAVAADAVAADPAPAKPSASLQMLFAVIGGALALAGLTASVIYRLGRGRQRRLATSERRAVLWDGVETAPRAPWVEPVEQPTRLPLPEQTRLPLPEHKAPPSIKAPSVNAPLSIKAPPSVRTQERYKNIEEILAQLVKQAQQSDA
jgi:hypothetical protein